jgi:hypothetical protein
MPMIAQQRSRSSVAQAMQAAVMMMMMRGVSSRCCSAVLTEVRTEPRTRARRSLTH